MKKHLIHWRFRSRLAGAALLGALATSSAPAQNFPTTLSSDSPICYWPFSESTVAPSLASISNATPVPGVGYFDVPSDTTQGQPGIVGNSVFFNNTGGIGDATGKIEIPWQAAFNPTPPFSVEFWAKPKDLSSAFLDTANATGLCALSSMDPYFFGANRSGYIFYLSTLGWEMRLGGENSYINSSTEIWGKSTQGGWDHIVGEFDGTTEYLYINGVLATNETVSPGFNTNGEAPLRIGSTLFYGGEARAGTGLPGAGNRGWYGWVDEVAVYPKLLTAGQVAAHFAAATTNNAGYHSQILADGPNGYWTLDEGPFNPSSTNSPAQNLGSIGADGNGTNTLGSQAGQAAPPYAGFPGGSHSVFYSGAQGSLVLGSPDSTLDNLVGNPISYVAWIRPTEINGWRTIIEQGWDTSTGIENYFRISDTLDWEGTGDPNVEYYEVGAFNGGSYASAVYPVPAGDVGNWVFLVGTWDGANWNLYRDGVLVNQFADTGGPVAVTGDPAWSVGSLSEANLEDGWYFAGNISQAAILPSALTSSQVLALYNSSEASPVITVPPSPPSSPVYLGASYTFTVQADGVQPLHYEWVSNGVAIASQNGSSFTLNNVGSGANGTYEVIVSNLYGAATSSVVFVVTPSLPPVSVSPVAETRWTGFPFEFSAEGVGSAVVNYSWELNNGSTGATSSNIIGTATSATAGTYTVSLNNSYGSITSTNSGVLTVLPVPTASPYVSTILGDHPIAYYRLDETSGDIAHDYIGGNDGVYNNAVLDQPGYVPTIIDPDPAARFTGDVNSYVGNIAPQSINLSGITNFTVECWANGENDQANGAALIAKGTGDVGNGAIANEQFLLNVNGSDYAFLVRSPANSTDNGYQATGSSGPDGAWHYIVGEWDGANVSIWVDGVEEAAQSGPATIRSSTFPISIGAERSGNDPNYDLDYNGTIDEVAIYNYALSQDQIGAHFAAAYGPNLPPKIALEPVSVTNYQGLAVMLGVDAFGTVPLTYTWNKTGSGPVAGVTGPTYAIPSLALSDAGTYTIGITNSLGGTNTVPFVLTVLPPPTTPPAIADLVVHLTFDNTLVDATGRGNNGTNMASGAYTPQNNYGPGKIGSGCLVYETDTNSAETNVSAHYVTLGLRPDLQFSSNVDFTVAFWIQEPINYTGNDLPFLTDVTNSTYGFGYVFAPSYGGSTSAWPGAWAYSLFDGNGNGVGVYGDQGWLNDGAWHHLAFVFNRKQGETTYFDGVSFNQNPLDNAAQPFVQSGTSAVSAGDIDNGAPATIGQDPTGEYLQSGGPFLMDDLLVFRRALASYEIGAIYTAGEDSGLSVTNAAVTTGTFTYSIGVNNSLILNWSAGTLQSSTNVTGPYNNTAATSPYTVPATNTASFFRVKF